MTTRQVLTAKAQVQSPTSKARTLAAGGRVPGTLPAGSSDGQEVIVSSAIRVLCVDDHAVLVEGLRAQFAISGDIEIVGWLSTAAAVLEEVTRLRPHAVLLDIEMPGPDVFEVADRLKRSQPEVRIIVLSAHIRDSFITASFTAGACAYFAKSDELSDILGGIREVMQSTKGTFVLGPKVRERCSPRLTPMKPGDRRQRPGQPTTLLEALTDRETEVLRLIGKGLTRTLIAKQLCRSVKTIDGHQERMMKKLGIATRADLMRFAIREGLAQA
ncbi:MAG TPA: response regulator transcription factor [Phycisphaerales bacterium]|nr:response regulator transcription factor [Phycisphaerales bacterium]